MRYSSYRKPMHVAAEGRKCPVDPRSRKPESRAPAAALECAPQESTGPQLFLTPHLTPKCPTLCWNLFAAVQRGLNQAIRVLSFLFGADAPLLPNSHWGLWWETLILGRPLPQSPHQPVTESPVPSPMSVVGGERKGPLALSCTLDSPGGPQQARSQERSRRLQGSPGFEACP